MRDFPTDKSLHPEFLLDSFGMFAYFRRGAITCQQTAVEANWTTGRENSIPTATDLLNHLELLHGLASQEGWPIQYFCAPNIGGIQYFEPVFGRLLTQANRDNLLDLITVLEGGRISNLAKLRQSEQVPEGREMVHGQGKVRIGSIVNTVGCRQIRMGIAKTSAKRKFAAIVQMNRQNFKLKVQ
jgi:hypothetical protein